MNADERIFLEQTEKTQRFTNMHPIYSELDKLGMIPPRCTGVTIELRAWQVPTVHVSAKAGPELSRWIEHLRGAKVELTVISGDPRNIPIEHFHDCREPIDAERVVDIIVADLKRGGKTSRVIRGIVQRRGPRSAG